MKEIKKHTTITAGLNKSTILTYKQKCELFTLRGNNNAYVWPTAQNIFHISNDKPDWPACRTTSAGASLHSKQGNYKQTINK